jgi:hypothetical protein
MIASVVSGDVAGAATKTLLSVLSATDRRPKLKQIIIGCTDGTPADNHVRFALRRMTADGTGTAVTPMPHDPGDGATPTCTSKKNYSAEPTYAAGNLAEFGLHQRATGVFEPPPGAVWTCAIGSGPGLGLQMLSATVKNYNVTFIFEE